MTHLSTARLALGVLLAAAVPGLARADGAHTLDKITINGNSLVPTDKLMAAVHEKVGTKVTVDEILADRDAIVGVYKDSKVNGNFSPKMITKSDGHIEVVFDITETGAVPTVTQHAAAVLDHEVFDGNTKIDSDTLMTASGLKPGQELTDANMLTARDAIGDAYKKANIGLQLSGSVAAGDKGEVITWHIVEAKAKKKKKNTEDDGFQTE